ncbi:hypothetical protein ACWE42_15570 [Sutcliffiella cohnii]
MDNDLKIIENEHDLIVRLESELKYDNLFNQIIERDVLKKELFNNAFIEALESDIHRWYSVAEAGRVIGGDKPIPPSSLTYYIENLEEYIIPEDAPSNKYIRLNYLSLVKLKMVLLLKDELRLSGLKAEVGITANSRNVIKNKSQSKLPSEIDGDNQDIYEKLEKLEKMNGVLFSLLIQKGEDGQPELKDELQSLLNSKTKLLEDQNTIYEKLENQEQIINQLKEENQELAEKIKTTEEGNVEISTKIKEVEKDREKIEESEGKIQLLTETIRTRQLAEAEWDSKGFFEKMKGNRAEYVSRRTKEILSEKGIQI